MTFLRAVTAHGTGAAAAQLKHPLGGKTGTTSDYTDAWFLGFSPRSPAASGSAMTAASLWAKRRPAPKPPCPSG